ncbi:MarR family transcriptional regulator [Actinoplanes sp. NPDC051411]|jgi:DNA-binding MarR family transcriptional regulator|uniref:MarR family winged helix-turn-helix transcriptional regulator n=1 Tax=Actinoplanes sp. NPDC051411 TaxID=3155522 RepID=UPI0034183F3E
MARRANWSRTGELAAAFSELGPTWGRWITACTPAASVSYSRMRLLRVLEQQGDCTMTQLASSMNVAQRRITSLVLALIEDGSVERRPNPDDGRSSVVSLTPQGREHLQLTWKQFQADIAEGFADLTEEQQRQLLEITPILTEALRRRTTARSAAGE